MAFIGVLIAVAAGIIFASKDSMVRYAFDKRMDETSVSAMIEMFKSYGKLSMGAGAILSPIMMLLGAGSLVGAVVLSNKEAK